MVKRKKYRFYAGTSGLVLPVPNKKSFPQEFRDKSRLTYYASLFNSIEINSSFKKIPLPATVEKWVNTVPDDFKFTFKISKWISHNKGLAFDPDEVKFFMDAVSAAGKKKGCILLQFPGQLSADYLNQLKHLLQLINELNKDKKWNIAVELRHQSWFQQNTYSLLKKSNAGLVMHDMPPFSIMPVDTWSDFAYLRFHGTERNYRGDYSNEYLQKIANDIHSYEETGKTVYVYFNNTLGNAVQNLITLNGYLTNSGTA